MDKKIKLLSVGKKKAKTINLDSWNKTVERYAPNMYESFYAAGQKDAIHKIVELQPEIVLLLPSILQSDLENGLQLVREIKRLHPSSVVFVNLGMVDDEQEAFDAYKAQGAYKCYSAPASMDTMFHDMYVALHLE